MKIGKYQIKELESVDKIFTKDITQNRSWYEKSWAGYFGAFYPVGFGINLVNIRIKNAFRFAICFYKNDKITWFWDARDLKRTRERVIKTYISNPKAISKWISDWQKDWNVFIKNANAMEKINLSSLSDKKLFEWCVKITDSYAITNSLPYIVDSFLSTGEEDWLVEIIKKELKTKVADENMAEVVGKLTLTVDNSFSQQEQVSLLHLASRIFSVEELKVKNADELYLKLKKYPELMKSLEKHAHDFYWIENGYFHAPRLTGKYFLEKICKLCGQDVGAMYKKELNQAKTNKKEKENLYKELNISDKTRKIIRLSEIFSKWQDNRKSAVFRVNYFIFGIFDEISRRKNIPAQQAYYMARQDIKDILLDGKCDMEKLKSRREDGCALIFTSKGWMLADGKEYKKINENIFFEKFTGAEELKGVSASPGKVKGVVRVIFKPTDFKKLKTGEILVTNNTTPDFVPIMKIAGAILTEQGGITSHAAVVSRELEIPCVIGIKSVTKILKDGDMVEVDAEKGIVKIIK